MPSKKVLASVLLNMSGRSSFSNCHGQWNNGVARQVYTVTIVKRLLVDELCHVSKARIHPIEPIEVRQEVTELDIDTDDTINGDEDEIAFRQVLMIVMKTLIMRV